MTDQLFPLIEKKLFCGLCLPVYSHKVPIPRLIPKFPHMAPAAFFSPSIRQMETANKLVVYICETESRLFHRNLCNKVLLM